MDLGRKLRVYKVVVRHPVGMKFEGANPRAWKESQSATGEYMDIYRNKRT